MNKEVLRKQADRYFNVWQELNAIYEEYAKKHGMSYTSLKILSLITKENGCTQKTLSEHTFLPKQTINAIITGFYKEGLIYLQELPSDRRTKNIYLTKKGRDFTDKIIPKIRRAEVEAMGRLDEKQRETLVALTELYVDHCREIMYEE